MGEIGLLFLELRVATKVGGFEHMKCQSACTFIEKYMYLYLRNTCISDDFLEFYYNFGERLHES